MRLLITVLFLVSFGSVSMAGVGDVYYCETTHYVEIREHRLLRHKPMKFKFIWESENKIKFGSDNNYFMDMSSKSVTSSFPSHEYFMATTKPFSLGVFGFDSGNFNYAYASTKGHKVVAITAKCGKF